MNKTVILTGGSRGIGHAAVKKFWNEGWRVITCSRTAFSSKCPWNSAEDNHFQVDLSDIESFLYASIALLFFASLQYLNTVFNLSS